MHLQLTLSLASKIDKIVNGLSGVNFERNFTQKNDNYSLRSEQ